MADDQRCFDAPALFEALLELPDADRPAFLDRACAGDPARRKEVARLLELLDRARTADLLPDILPLSPDGHAGQEVGPYRIVRPIGEGGMGAVFLAIRSDVGKEVALKVVRGGRFATGDQIKRFLLERRVLARLEHPNIARLLDAGLTADGLPYLAMEYVKGTALDRFCDQNRATVDERLRLFRAVCQAVQYAHQRLVIHRDLKPSNILITSDGAVKLLDFGIAKLLDEADPAGSSATGTGMVLLTPDYASPEQVRGQPVTTASDVYSLGVVLYELLTGHRPYRVRSRALPDLERSVCSAEPERPSSAVLLGDSMERSACDGTRRTPELVSQARGTSPAGLRRRLRGDLDTILAKALAKEPARRYISVDRFADDLRRHQERRPVLARRDSPGYRAGRFVRRHRGSLGATALLVLSLVVGLVTTARQARRAEVQRAIAEERFGQVRALARTMLFDFHDAIADLPGATRARALLVRTGLDYLTRLQQQSVGDRDLLRELAEGYLRLGLVQGQPTGASFGSLAGARESYQKALALAEHLVDTDPRDARARRTLAVVHEKLGDVESWGGNLPAGVAHARHALREFARLADEAPGQERPHLSLAISHIKLGDLLGNPSFPNLGDSAGALSEYREALATLGGLDSRGPEHSLVRRYLGLVQERMGTMFAAGGRQDEAFRAHRQSLALREALAREQGASADVQRDVAVSQSNLCQLHLARHASRAALTRCRTALRLYRGLRDADSTNAQGLGDLASAHRGLFEVLAARDEWAGALDEVERSIALERQLLATDSSSVPARRHLAEDQLRASLAHARLAAGSGGRNRSDPAHRRQARTLYQLGRDAVRQLEQRGLTDLDGDRLVKAVAAALPTTSGK